MPTSSLINMNLTNRRSTFFPLPSPVSLHLGDMERAYKPKLASYAPRQNDSDKGQNSRCMHGS